MNPVGFTDRAGSGAVSKKLDIAEDTRIQAIEKMVPKKVLQLNKKAFAMGRTLC